jgi:hypothetical protein
LKIKDTYNTIEAASEEILFKERAASFWLCFSHSIEEELKLIIEQLKKIPQAILLRLSNRHRNCFL